MPNSTVTTTAEIEEYLLGAIAELGAEADMITREALLESLDVDSLDIVELGQMVDERYGVELRAEDVKDLQTVGELFDVVIAAVERAQG